MNQDWGGNSDQNGNNQQLQDQSEQETLKFIMQSKKEKFRVDIRQSHNKIIFNKKRELLKGQAFNQQQQQQHQQQQQQPQDDKQIQNIIQQTANNQIANIKEFSDMLENVLINIDNNNQFVNILNQNNMYQYLLYHFMQDHLFQDYDALFNTIKVFTSLCNDGMVCQYLIQNKIISRILKLGQDHESVMIKSELISLLGNILAEDNIQIQKQMHCDILHWLNETMIYVAQNQWINKIQNVQKLKDFLEEICRCLKNQMQYIENFDHHSTFNVMLIIDHIFHQYPQLLEQDNKLQISEIFLRYIESYNDNSDIMIQIFDAVRHILLQIFETNNFLSNISRKDLFEQICNNLNHGLSCLLNSESYVACNAIDLGAFDYIAYFLFQNNAKLVFQGLDILTSILNHVQIEQIDLLLLYKNKMKQQDYIIDKVIDLIQHTADSDVMREAIFVIDLILSNGDRGHCKLLFEKEVLNILCGILNLQMDAQTLKYILGCFKSFLYYGQIIMDETQSKINPYQKIIGKSGCEKLFEDLQIHEDEQVYQMMYEILEQHYQCTEKQN